MLLSVKTYCSLGKIVTLKRSCKWPPYIFNANLESENQSYEIYNYVIDQCFAETLQVISFNKTSKSCTDEVRVKVPSFQKVTLFTSI